ncbi:hypothetical protein RJT34_23126 [Clitoria ternatea]|uniref:Uncharacterized protein n=1 Tax=Clitoria ternatea TaxID=43366 RepID=A0AAN9FNH1_CLITE
MKETLAARQTVDPSGEILVLNKFYPNLSANEYTLEEFIHSGTLCGRECSAERLNLREKKIAYTHKVLAQFFH